MRRLILVSTLLACLASFELYAQAPADAPTQKLADEFMKRYNLLGNWTLSVDGKEEGVEPLVNSMMELFAPDVIAEVPPHDEEQIGPVMLRGSDNVRKWVDRIARTQVRFNYIIRRQTGGPGGEFEGWRVIYATPLPWGGKGISFQIIAAYSLRENRRRYTAPGAVFIQYGEDGKIHKLRLLLGEISEVVPL